MKEIKKEVPHSKLELIFYDQRVMLTRIVVTSAMVIFFAGVTVVAVVLVGWRLLGFLILK